MAMKDEEVLSVRDKIFGVLAAFSALYCVALSFELSLPGARKRFWIGLTVLTLSFSLVRYKKAVALGVLGFIAIRFIWAGVLLLFRH
jgi:hypothetical protein